MVSGERRFPWFPIVTVIVMIVVGFWTRHAVNKSLTTILTQRLEAVLDTDLPALSEGRANSGQQSGDMMPRCLLHYCQLASAKCLIP